MFETLVITGLLLTNIALILNIKSIKNLETDLRLEIETLKEALKWVEFS